MSQFYIPTTTSVIHVALDTIKFLQSNPHKYIRLHNSNQSLPIINSFLLTKPKQMKERKKDNEYIAQQKSSTQKRQVEKH